MGLPACVSVGNLELGFPLSGDEGAYRVLGRIATGGMASIHLARREGDLESGTLAIKRVLPEKASNTDLVAFFAQERRLLELCDHPNIVTRVDGGWHDGLPFLVMEHVDGADLCEIARMFAVSGRPMPHGLAIKVIHDVLDALAHAHDHGIVHRDVSPMNVLISNRGEVKLIDFGIATIADGLNDSGRQTLRGRIPYLAPELFAGVTADARSDLWSVGVMLWELLAGRVLFHHAKRDKLVQQILRDPVRPIREKRSDVPHDIMAVLSSLLERDVDRRFQRADDVRDRLRECAADHGWSLENKAASVSLNRVKTDCGLPTRLSVVPDPPPQKSPDMDPIVTPLKRRFKSLVIAASAALGTLAGILSALS